jgi:SAM-dependent methyltransferase
MTSELFYDRSNEQQGLASAEVLYGYQYADLNRDSGALWEAFGPIDDMGPHGVLADIYHRQGHATVLDVGCGTGRQLQSLVTQAVNTFGLDPSKIFADGVSDYDFSRIGQPNTLVAIQSGQVNYTVLDLGEKPLPSQSYDLIYSYETLVGAPEPAVVVDTIWQALRPGGVAYFNLNGEQLTGNMSFLLNEINEQDEVRVVRLEPSRFMRLRHERSDDFAPLPTRYAYKITKTQ